MKYEPEDVPLVDVIGAPANRPFGHIALGEPDSMAAITFCDMGPVLRLWSHTAGDLTPAAARNLADELARWADRKENR